MCQPRIPVARMLSFLQCVYRHRSCKFLFASAGTTLELHHTSLWFKSAGDLRVLRFLCCRQSRCSRGVIAVICHAIFRVYLKKGTYHRRRKPEATVRSLVYEKVSFPASCGTLKRQKRTMIWRAHWLRMFIPPQVGNPSFASL